MIHGLYGACGTLLLVLGVCLGMLTGDRDAPGDVKAGRCAKGAARGCRSKSLLLQARETEEVSPRQSARTKKAGLQQKPAILNSLLMKNTSAVELPRSPRCRHAFWFHNSCCRTFYFSIFETKLESIFNPFPFPFSVFSCHSAITLTLQKLIQGLGEAKGQAAGPV